MQSTFGRQGLTFFFFFIFAIPESPAYDMDGVFQNIFPLQLRLLPWHDIHQQEMDKVL